MEKIYIIKKNGEMYWNLNTTYKHKSRAQIALKVHLETLIPKINESRKKEHHIVIKKRLLKILLNNSK